MEEIILKVQGMHCEGCENRIQKSVGKLDGVKNVVADFKAGTVTVTIEKEAKLDTIKERIENMGFSVE